MDDDPHFLCLSHLDIVGIVSGTQEVNDKRVNNNLQGFIDQCEEGILETGKKNKNIK